MAMALCRLQYVQYVQCSACAGFMIVLYIYMDVPLCIGVRLPEYITHAIQLALHDLSCFYCCFGIENGIHMFLELVHFTFAEYYM